MAIYLLWPIWERDTRAVGISETVRTAESETTASRKGRNTTDTTRVEEKVSRDNGPIAALLEETGFLVLARLGLVAVTSFIAGAATQRILLGEFAIKVGNVELAQIPGEEVSKSLDKAVSGLFS
ncbi:MAG: hypothetical protein M3273_00005 [Actinomycetota bacterium]|nr:hypothetical protein [Actinomycetota bacterium]